MTSIVKIAALAAFSFALVVPTFAAEGTSGRSMTKGSKSYQSAKGKTMQDQVASSQQTDVTKIEPAAGGSAEAEQASNKGKSFKEGLRLPRKN